MRRANIELSRASSRTRATRATVEIGVAIACVAAMVCAVGVTFGCGRLARVASSTPSREVREVVEVVVAPGDTLWSIAKRHVGKEVDIRAAVRDIMALNHLSSAVLRPGQVVMVRAEVVADGDIQRPSDDWALGDESVAAAGYER